MSNDQGSSQISGGIHFTGLGSGTDFDSITEQLLKVEGIQKKRMETWRASWETKMKAFDELNTTMVELKSTLQKLDTPAEFVEKAVSSTSSTALSAKADADAMEGSHSIIIGLLAENEVRISANYYTAEDAILTSNGGQFVYTYDGKTVTVDVASNTTLEGLANLITRDSDNPGIRAEVVKMADDVYRLRILGMDLGSDHEITIDGSTTLTGFTSDAVPRMKTAHDALVNVDGINYLRDTNYITDIIPGVKLTLKKADVGETINITVTQDKETIKENIKAFVDKVNEIRTALKEMTKVDKKTGKGSLLTGNYGLQMIESKLENVTAASAIGFLPWDKSTGQGDYYSTLAQLGILTDADSGSATNGLLVIDEEKLKDALDNHLDAVADLFSSNYEGVSDSDKFIFSSLVKGTTQAGSYDVRFSISGGVVQSGATIGGYPADYDKATKELTAKDGPAKGMAIRITDFSDTTDYKGTVRIKLGKVGQMVETLGEMTNKNDGTLKVLEDNYQDIIDGIDKKIDREERRLSSMEKTLKMKWARLETTLGKYNSILTQLQSQISQLTKG